MGLSRIDLATAAMDTASPSDQDTAIEKAREKSLTVYRLSPPPDAGEFCGEREEETGDHDEDVGEEEQGEEYCYEGETSSDDGSDGERTKE